MTPELLSIPQGWSHPVQTPDPQIGCLGLLLHKLQGSLVRPPGPWPLAPRPLEGHTGMQGTAILQKVLEEEVGPLPPSASRVQST